MRLAVDIAFVIDATGSMSGLIADAQRRLVEMLRAFGGVANVDLAVGVIEYRDHPGQESSFLTRAHPFTGDLQRVQRTINSLAAHGGGDAPEAVYDGLAAACTELSWRANAERMAVLIGDAPPHGWPGAHGDHWPRGCPCGKSLEDTTALLEETGVVLYAIPLTREAEPPFTALSRGTGGRCFAVGGATGAMAHVQAILERTAQDIGFDTRLFELLRTAPDLDFETAAERLHSSRPTVAASYSRLVLRQLI